MNLRFSGGGKFSVYSAGRDWKRIPQRPRANWSALKANRFRNIARKLGTCRPMNICAVPLGGAGHRKAHAKAMPWYRSAAARGIDLAMLKIGKDYYLGQSGPRDYAQAMAWCRMAAATGNGFAMYGIGVLYSRGEGVPQDHAAAMAWWRKAAAKGLGEAMYAIGMLHYTGNGVPPDQNEALLWMQRADAAGGQAAILAREVIARIKGS